MCGARGGGADLAISTLSEYFSPSCTSTGILPPNSPSSHAGLASGLTGVHVCAICFASSTIRTQWLNGQSPTSEPAGPALTSSSIVSGVDATAPGLTLARAGATLTLPAASTPLSVR